MGDDEALGLDDFHIGDFHIPHFRPPSPEVLGPGPLRVLGEVERAIRSKSSGDLYAWIEKANNPADRDLKSRLESWRHPLSSYLLFMDGFEKKRSTSRLEAEIAQRLSHADDPDPRTAIRTIIRMIGVSNHDIRQKQVGTNQDKFGNRCIFPDPMVIDGLLTDLVRGAEVHRHRSPLWAAIISYCGICAIHPFEDGNGRTGRIVFNLIMMRNCNSVHYFPIVEVNDIAHGSFIIRLRDAVYNGNWDGIVEHVCGAYRAFLGDGAG